MEIDQGNPAADHRIGVEDATSLVSEVFELSRAFQARMRREMSVNATDLDAIEYIIRWGPMTASELARRLAVTTAAVTAVIDRLVAQGHAERRPHPTDRRALLVAPTSGSTTRAMSIIMPMVASIDAVMGEFAPDERATITHYLQRVVDSYRPHVLD